MTNYQSDSTTSNYLGDDHYTESSEQILTGDTLEAFERKLSPKSFRKRMKGVYDFTKVVKAVYPFISGITLVALGMLIAFDIQKAIHEGLSLTEWVMSILSFIVALAAIGLVEYLKSTNLSSWAKANYRRDTIPTGTKAVAIMCTSISLLGSGAGIAMATYAINDRSHQIRNAVSFDKSTALSTFSADSLQAIQFYSPLIDAKRETKSKYNSTKYRTLRNGIDNEIIALTTQMNESIADARKRRDNTIASSKSEGTLALNQNQSKGKNLAIIMFVLIGFGEAIYIVSHFYIWRYRVKSLIEARRFTPGQPTRTKQRDALSARPVVSNKTIPANTRKEVTVPLGKASRSNAARNDASRSNATGDDAGTDQEARKNVGETYECEHCGTPYKARAIHQKFCSSECREEHWKANTGKTFKKGKK